MQYHIVDIVGYKSGYSGLLWIILRGTILAEVKLWIGCINDYIVCVNNYLRDWWLPEELRKGWGRCCHRAKPRRSPTHPKQAAQFQVKSYLNFHIFVVQARFLSKFTVVYFSWKQMTYFYYRSEILEYFSWKQITEKKCI